MKKLILVLLFALSACVYLPQPPTPTPLPWNHPCMIIPDDPSCLHPVP